MNRLKFALAAGAIALAGGAWSPSKADHCPIDNPACGGGPAPNPRIEERIDRIEERAAVRAAQIAGRDGPRAAEQLQRLEERTDARIQRLLNRQ